MTQTDSNTSRFSVFFDGGCPLCVREIGFYQRQDGADDIDWVDLSRLSGDMATQGLSCQMALSRFHVQTQSGDLLQGGTAFAALWQQLPKFKRFGDLGRRAPFRWVLNLAYRAFLPLRPGLQKLAGWIWGAPKQTQ